MKPKLLLHRALFAFAFFIGMESGAAIFTSFVVFPAWASSPEAAIGWVPTMPYYMEEGDVFKYLSSLTMLSAVVVLIAGWKVAPPLRNWLRIATISFIIVFIWSVLYFIPIQDNTFKGEAGVKIPRDELASKLKMFVLLNYLRIAMVVFGFILSLHMLGLSYRLRSKE